MPKAILLLFLGLALAGTTSCTTYSVGSSGESGPNGSYAGSTLNSPVTDQNPHVGGGDSSYPSSVSDTGQLPPPPDKVDGR